MTAPATIAPVSVVVPCFRCSDTIERAVRSVAQQTLRPAELILVDDASPDGTAAALDSLRAKYGADWIRVLRLPVNSGPATARNAGWDAAREKYVAFLDADDAWHPGKIEIQLAWMEAHPEVVVTGHGAAQLHSGSPFPSDPGNGEALIVTTQALFASNRFVTPSVMVRREIPQRFQPGARHMEDYLLWLEIAAGGLAIAKLPHVLAYTFKAPYGEAGLSAQLWSMEKGELQVFLALRRKGLLGAGLWLCLSAYSLLKFLRRMLMVAAGYSPGGNVPKPALAYAASYLFLTQSMTALLIFAGLFGRSELAADVGVVQAATLATFYSFSGNARNLILTLRSPVPREAILAARLLLLLPLGAAAALLCVAVARIDPALALILIGRRAVEWIAELYLSECELLGKRAEALRSLVVQAVLLIIVVGTTAFAPERLLWALGAWAIVPALSLRSVVASGLHGFDLLRKHASLLLPHFGSTAISGISLYAFRALLVLLVGKPIAGSLFAAFALGSFPGSLFGNVLGPSVALHEERVGRAYLPRAIWLMTTAYVASGFLLLGATWFLPGLEALTGKSVFFWSAMGWSLLGGAIMLVAQRIRLRLLGQNRADAVFGADVIMYVCLVAAVPALYATGRLGALAGLYALNAVLALFFYLTANEGFLGRFEPRARDWIWAILCFLVFLPLFFLLDGSIFNPSQPLFDSGGVLAKLPLPVSLLACGLGIVLSGQYGRATSALWTILGLLFLMLVSTVAAHGASDPLERAKMFLLLQVALPAFGLILGSLAGADGRRWQYLKYSILAAVTAVVPTQLAFTLHERTFSLSHHAGLFSVYQHWQFVPVILVSAFLLALPSTWANASRATRCAIALLFMLVAAYAMAALSVLSVAAVAAGSVMFAASRIWKRDIGGALAGVLALVALIAYGALIRNTDAFHNKFDFVFPPNDPWVAVEPGVGVRRTFENEWRLVGSGDNVVIMRILAPIKADRATVVVEGVLSEGALSFAAEHAGGPRLLATVGDHGPFKLRLTIDKNGGDGHILVTQVASPLRGVIHRMLWEFPAGSAAGPRQDGPAVEIRNVGERFSDWRLFGLGIFDSWHTLVFGHANPLSREQRSSAHNFYIDLVYNFGVLALAPLFALGVYTLFGLWRFRRDVLASDWLLPLAVLVGFLVLMESSLKVTLRQPYPGIAIYFLWGLLLARLAALRTGSAAKGA